MTRARGDRQSGAGTVEYVGIIIGVAAMVAVLLVAFPSIGEQLACRLSQAVGAISGGGSASCSGGTSGDQTAGSGGSGGGDFVVPRTTATGPGTSSVVFEVNVPEGENWTVVSDQPWVSVPDGRVFDGPTIRGFGGQYGGGNGPGALTAVVNANPNANGESRTATLTFTGPNGETFTQEITQPGGTAQTVVLGDSFSAGNGSVRDNPDGGADDGCHRSSRSWGRLIEARSDVSAPLTGFGACSGATVDGANLSDDGSSSSLLAQIEANRDALAQADQVAFSIGGNDIGFASIVQDCIMPVNTVKNCRNAVRDGRWLINGRGNEPSPLSPRLEEAYRAALEAAPNATVYIVGYPPMVELGDPSGGFLNIKKENVPELVGMINDLNFQIAATVDRVNRSTPGGARLVFVDPTAADSPFHGHSLTGDDPYYHSLDINWRWDFWNTNVDPGSFHPNDAGNDAYAQWVSEYMRGER